MVSAMTKAKPSRRTLSNSVEASELEGLCMGELYGLPWMRVRRYEGAVHRGALVTASTFAEHIDPGYPLCLSFSQHTRHAVIGCAIRRIDLQGGLCSLSGGNTQLHVQLSLTYQRIVPIHHAVLVDGQMDGGGLLGCHLR